MVSGLATAAAAQAPNNPKDDFDPASVASLASNQAPINLKVLPKTLTGRQVRQIMRQWSGDLGVRCVACHVGKPEGIISDGPVKSNFADDSKPMKESARLMYTMTEAINSKFIARVDGSGLPVTCGTCHRGNLGPEPFATLPEQILPPASAVPATNSNSEQPSLGQPK